MKKFSIIFLLFLSLCFGQGQELDFATEYYDAVDKWVAFGKNSDTCIAGFIYIDENAGFTFHYGTNFTVTSSGLKKSPTTVTESILKMRLSSNTARVAVLSDKQIKQLGLPKEPEWLKFYKPNPNENQSLYLARIGYFYNHVGASQNAIAPLLKVYEKEPHFQGLEFELAYAYNAINDFDKAIAVLNKAIENDPENFWFYRELGFSLKNQGKLDDAEKIYSKGIELSNQKTQKAEMAYNMAQSYFYAKNKQKFEKWAKLTKEYAEKNSQLYQYIEYFEENWAK